MAKLNNKIFSLVSKDGNSVVVSLTKKLTQRMNQYDKLMQQRMNTATSLVWRTAHAKRPMITKAMTKAQGRAFPVSDPNATAGVPVAYKNGGRLQVSVMMKVAKSLLGGPMSYEGTVTAGGGNAPYATFLEYGTSKMPARPFMRPAITLNKEAIKRTFGARITSNLQ
jgi:HK97 gp10 family phage protein